MIARNGLELLHICKENNYKLSDFAINYEIENRGITKEQVIDEMRTVLHVMQESTSSCSTKRDIFSKWINWWRCL